jgi:hypothetical protein
VNRANPSRQTVAGFSSGMGLSWNQPLLSRRCQEPADPSNHLPPAHVTEIKYSFFLCFFWATEVREAKTNIANKGIISRVSSFFFWNQFQFYMSISVQQDPVWFRVVERVAAD